MMLRDFRIGIRGVLRQFMGVPPEPDRFALVLSGGGARAAYQAGVMQYVAEAFPEANFSILNGISAGAINAAHLANYDGGFADAAKSLVEIWEQVHEHEVYTPASSFQFIHGFLKHVIGGRSAAIGAEDRRGLVDTEPLRSYLQGKFDTTDGVLHGVRRNIEHGRLRALSIATTNYMTGQTVTWVEGDNLPEWSQSGRMGVNTTMTIEHIMASTALPILFPAVQIDDAWYGDGGIRLSAPISPVIDLGADRIFVISTRYERTRREAQEYSIAGYPPPATIIGVLMNAIFLDVLDRDARILEQFNELIKHVPQSRRGDFRPLKMLLIRPSRDLGKMASQYDVRTEGVLGLLTRGLGTGESTSPDWLSMLLFDQPYMQDLLEIGYNDGRTRHDDIAEFLKHSEKTGAPLPRISRRIRDYSVV